MVSVVFSGVVYTAVLLGCYDGDTCTLSFQQAPPFLATQKVRFVDFDTPELGSAKCVSERKLAEKARDFTQVFMEGQGLLYTDGKRGKYGRLLVSAPELRDTLIYKKLARAYRGGKRDGWCG